MGTAQANGTRAMAVVAQTERSQDVERAANIKRAISLETATVMYANGDADAVASVRTLRAQLAAILDKHADDTTFNADVIHAAYGTQALATVAFNAPAPAQPKEKKQDTGIDIVPFDPTLHHGRNRFYLFNDNSRQFVPFRAQKQRMRNADYSRFQLFVDNRLLGHYVITEKSIKSEQWYVDADI